MRKAIIYILLFTGLAVTPCGAKHKDSIALGGLISTPISFRIEKERNQYLLKTEKKAYKLSKKNNAFAFLNDDVEQTFLSNVYDLVPSFQPFIEEIGVDSFLKKVDNSDGLRLVQESAAVGKASQSDNTNAQLGNKIEEKEPIDKWKWLWISIVIALCIGVVVYIKKNLPKPGSIKSDNISTDDEKNNTPSAPAKENANESKPGKNPQGGFSGKKKGQAKADKENKDAMEKYEMDLRKILSIDPKYTGQGLLEEIEAFYARLKIQIAEGVNEIKKNDTEIKELKTRNDNQSTELNELKQKVTKITNDDTDRKKYLNNVNTEYIVPFEDFYRTGKSKDHLTPESRKNIIENLVPLAFHFISYTKKELIRNNDEDIDNIRYILENTEPTVAPTGVDINKVITPHLVCHLIELVKDNNADRLRKVTIEGNYVNLKE